MSHFNAGISLAALSVWLVACVDPCENRVVSELDAPGRNTRAIVFERSCGATTGFSTHVSVLNASDPLPKSVGNIFDADSDHGAAQNMTVTLRWAAPDQLVCAVSSTRAGLPEGDSGERGSGNIRGRAVVVWEPAQTPLHAFSNHAVKLEQEETALSAGKYLVLLASALAYAQTAPRPTFEVASLKPSQSGEPARLTSNPGMWSCTNCRLFDLFGHAYKVFEYQILAPDWTKAATFDVIAKLPSGVAPGAWALNVNEDPFALMMQSLLEERFQMAVRRERREIPVYELVVAKGGHKLKEVTEPAPAPPPGPSIDKDGFPNIPGGNGMRLLPDRGRIQFQRQAMVHVAHFISTQVDRPVLDSTELGGRYALTLSWYRARPAAASVSTAGVPVAADPLQGPTIFEALQNQLGLRLQPAKGTVEMVVIDRLEKKPIGN